MNTLSKTILDQWQIRKTKRQKRAFIEFMQEELPDLEVEEGGFIRSRNLVLGDLSSAKVICTAHYDTCARMFFPNFLTPKNTLCYIGYLLLVFAVLFIPVLLITQLLYWLPLQEPFDTLVGYVPMLLVVVECFLMLCGPANPHTVNDNTSGVVTLCELIRGMSDEERKDMAFVFFDNEEKGLLGSALFQKMHKRDNLKNKLIVNFDCVSDGDHIMLVMTKPARKVWGNKLREAFHDDAGLTVHHFKSFNTMYPSDQANFRMSVGIAAMKHRKFVGLYINRIHTRKDTVMREENITYLVERTKQLVSTSKQ